jgi:hypothetical protein
MSILALTAMIAFFSHNDCDKISTDTPFQKQIIPIESGFNSLTIYNNLNVILEEGDHNEIQVNNIGIVGKIKVEVNDNVLIIKCRHLFLRNDNFKILILVKSIKNISLMGDAEVRTIGCLNSPILKLNILGDGAIYANTKANEVDTFIKGLGKIVVKGNFRNTTVNRDAYGNMTSTYNNSAQVSDSVKNQLR